MKYVYYDPENGEIRGMAGSKDPVAEYPYIEVEDVEVEDIFFGRKKSLDYYVKTISKTSTVGSVVPKIKRERVWRSINDWLYLIPKSAEFVEVTIEQNMTTKTISVKLTEEAREWWNTNKFFSKPYFLLSACASADPHTMLWTKIIPSASLLDTIAIDYTGRDDIRFYTHRYFESYIHEQHT
jgi:hypothetical protein